MTQRMTNTFWEVVPAYAGVIRKLRALLRPLLSGPRVCGGDPSL